ncbi:glycosyltransferase [Oceaniovalibus guishaninsula]|nr:glycosyltransferase family 2 protein [Oceaniovalibus guishaninsula]
MPQDSPMQRIAAIVVNYGTADLTIAAVQSVLARHHGGRDVAVHVVDNASPGGDAAALAAAHEAHGWGARVTLWPQTVNHGFGRANNLVSQALAAGDAPPDAVFLLNPDARLENEAIDILAASLEADPRLGFAGAGVLSPEGVPVTAAFRFPSALGEFAQALGFGPVARACRSRLVPLPPDHPEGRVDWVTGAAVLIRMQALREIGHFDPAFFLYYEEVDLMRQGARLGWTARHVPRARIVHVEGAATGSGRPVRARRPAYRYRSWRHYYTKNHGRGGAILAGLALMAGMAGNHVLSRLARRDPPRIERFFGDFWAHAMGPALGLRADSVSDDHKG